MKETILVTGYGGFLGAAICRWLLRRGYRVRGVARQHYPELNALGVESIAADLCDATSVAAACRGVDAIIHTAAKAGVWGDRKEYEAINVGATLELLSVARQLGIGTFVYCSSPSVTFDGTPQSGIDERAPYPKKWYCDYPRTKAIAEQAVLAANEPGVLLTCSLRPHLIWGAGDPHLFPRVIERCRSGRLKRVGSGRNLIDTVHVEHAAEAHGLALEKLLKGEKGPSGRAYFVTDEAPIACWDWITQILSLEGLKAPRSAIPLSLAFAVGGLMELIYRISRRKDEPPMTRFVALQLGVDHYFSNEAAKKMIGYHPFMDRDATMEALRGAWRK